MSEVFNFGSGESIELTPPQPSVLTFLAGDVWALRITKGGITGNPDVPVDDAARAILNALAPMIRGLK